MVFCVGNIVFMRFPGVYLTIAVVTLAPAVAHGLMTSSSYRLYGDELGAAGGRSTSSSYIEQDTTGGMAIGDSSSTNYTLLSGFQALSEHPTFSFSVSSPTVALGTLSTSSVATGVHTFTTSTNAPLGFTVVATADGDLRAGPEALNGVSDGSVTAGAEEYGVGLIGTDRAFTDDRAPTSGGLTVATRSNWKNGSVVTVLYKAAISSSTMSGSYAQALTYVGTGLF